MSSSGLPSVLAELVAYFAPLASERRDRGGAVTLQTPGVNVLALNATFLPGADCAPDGTSPQGRARLVATAVPVAGEEVGAVRVGSYLPQGRAGGVVVEQVSRLSLPLWAGVLAEAYETPEWAPALARHLAARLEGDRDTALLLAYAGGEALGALLWRAGPGGGGHAHLWGTLDPGVDAPLLNAAQALGTHLRASLPDSSPLALVGGETVRFSLL
ncbi:hypothetical protein [Deinococcus budaensis]|uniref:Uncharacterized protein n=1 Tax=Deinococcus budaensis TaxID=1665626 RepID=A0A7W8LR88_9DEIO|nr:hypothetical protein [Deinococcus budaensis]MBB5235387.1 hypothetical protein [Deinococcus budaensis]